MRALLLLFVAIDVPQGAVLGLILLSVHVKDIHVYVNNIVPEAADK